MTRWLFAASLALVLGASSVRAGRRAGPVDATQTPDGAAIYRDHCASCHDTPTSRTPARDALSARTADAIVASLTGGSMMVQAVALGPGEKRAVAEFLAAKPAAAKPSNAAVDPGLCAARAAALRDPASMPRWSGWGNDPGNSRFQPQPGITAAEVPTLTLKWAFGF
ncbi:MAG: pyrrolo-quinoline quinone, partial [Acidobacteria bacterium]